MAQFGLEPGRPDWKSDVVTIILPRKLSSTFGCYPWGKTSNPSLARKKADVFKINGDDDDAFVSANSIGRKPKKL